MSCGWGVGGGYVPEGSGSRAGWAKRVSQPEKGRLRRFHSPAQVGGEFAVSLAEQQRQIEALRTLEGCLAALCADEPDRFEGLSIRWGRVT